ncbi:MAG: hypothetical protein J3K34DRAFT_476634 [Monoraphidium minutum]|nr:MAG: hypothetical protein J3K34DRAFT_476634 [Monoraphidium minutum]
MAARVALCGLLGRLGVAEADADEALLDYVCTVIEDAEDEDAGSEALMEQVQELLAALAPAAFAGAPGVEQQRIVLELFEAARCSAGNNASSSVSSGSGSAPPGPPGGGISAAALVASLRQLEVNALSAPPASGKGARAGGGGAAPRRRQSSADDAAAGADGGGAAACLENADPAALAALREMCSSAVSDVFLAHALVRRHGGDAEAAACWLVELEDLATEERAWRDGLEEGRREAARGERERKQSKAAILARFDLQAVSAPVEGRQKERPVEAWAAGKKQQQPAGKVRYRDGMVVSSSGEKYIVQKTTPDFDGGSRGKVYTKGKRGKGFV